VALSATVIFVWPVSIRISNLNRISSLVTEKMAKNLNLKWRLSPSWILVKVEFWVTLTLVWSMSIHQRTKFEAKIFVNDRDMAKNPSLSWRPSPSEILTREDGNHSDVLPSKATQRDSISNLTSFGASNVSCRVQTNPMPFHFESLWGATLLPLKKCVMDWDETKQWGRVKTPARC